MGEEKVIVEKGYWGDPYTGAKSIQVSGSRLLLQSLQIGIKVNSYLFNYLVVLLITKLAYELLFNIKFEARVELISPSIFIASIVNNYFKISSIEYYRYSLLQILKSIDILFINIQVMKVSFKLSYKVLIISFKVRLVSLQNNIYLQLSIFSYISYICCSNFLLFSIIVVRLHNKIITIINLETS